MFVSLSFNLNNNNNNNIIYKIYIAPKMYIALLETFESHIIEYQR